MITDEQAINLAKSLTNDQIKQIAESRLMHCGEWVKFDYYDETTWPRKILSNDSPNGNPHVVTAYAKKCFKGQAFWNDVLKVWNVKGHNKPWFNSRITHYFYPPKKPRLTINKSRKLQSDRLIKERADSECQNFNI
jgi:hypothetical protein